MLFLALLPTLIAVGLFAATCNLQLAQPKPPRVSPPRLTAPRDDPTPPPPNFGAIA